MLEELSWGQRIINIQEKLGCTISQLAIELGIGRKTIYNILDNSTKNPNNTIQEKIIKKEKEISANPIESLKENIITTIQKSKPEIYETQLLNDEQKIKLIRLMNDFIRGLNEFEF